MFSHHILKPERTPIEANIWGTPRSSGAFSTLFKSRLLRALEYREAPTEVTAANGEKGTVCSLPFAGRIGAWPDGGPLAPRSVCLSCGDSAATGLADNSIGLVVTDPPFFDNVHYSELADFFYAWQQAASNRSGSTRHGAEVQDTDARSFARKLQAVFRECRRALKDDGLLVFTYHHSRGEGWNAVAEAILGSGFLAVNSQPVKSEMSVATPKSAAKEPIQLDIILVCRKAEANSGRKMPSADDALKSAREKLKRLEGAGFKLSRNDRKIVLFGQLLLTATSAADTDEISRRVEGELGSLDLEDGPLFRQLPA